MLLLVDVEIFLKREYQNVEQLQVFFILKEYLKTPLYPVKLLRKSRTDPGWMHKFVLLLVNAIIVQGKTMNRVRGMIQDISVCNSFGQHFLVFLKRYSCAFCKDIRVLLTILATNTNNLDNHNLFFIPFHPDK